VRLHRCVVGQLYIYCGNINSVFKSKSMVGTGKVAREEKVTIVDVLVSKRE
jgi:hypothetical protein